MKTKILIPLLTLACLLAMPARAQVNYAVSGGSAYVTSSPNASGNIVIASTYQGKPVTSSDSLPVIGELSFITDGDKSGTDGTYVELGPTPQWVQIDLGAKANIAAIVVWHFHSQARVYHDVVVQVSDDPEFKTGVTTLYNNDSDNSAGLGVGTDREYFELEFGRVVAGKGVKARYVRGYTKGGSLTALNCWQEIEVYALPAK